MYAIRDPETGKEYEQIADLVMSDKKEQPTLLMPEDKNNIRINHAEYLGLSQIAFGNGIPFIGAEVRSRPPGTNARLQPVPLFNTRLGRFVQTDDSWDPKTTYTSQIIHLRIDPKLVENQIRSFYEHRMMRRSI